MEDKVCVKIEAEGKYKLVNLINGGIEVVGKENLIKHIEKGEKVRNLAVDTTIFGTGSKAKKQKDIKITDGPIGAYYYTSAYENEFIRKQYIISVVLDENDNEIGYNLMDEHGTCRVVDKEAFLNYIKAFGPRVLLNGRYKLLKGDNVETKAEKIKCNMLENKIKERIQYIESQNRYLESIGSKARVYSLLDKIAVRCIDTDVLEIDVPSGVTIINGDDLKECKKLGELFIDDSVDSIINCDNIRTTRRKYTNVN